MGGRNKVTVGGVDSVDFAIYFNTRAVALGKTVTVTKIQKWLYMCYGLYLVTDNRQLLCERPKAWDFGPAFPRVYAWQKKTNGNLLELPIRTALSLLTRYDALIETTLNMFGDWPAGELVAWTNEKDKAWEKTVNLMGLHATMDNNDIYLDFKDLLPKEEAETV